MGILDIFKPNIKKLEANKDVQGLIEASSKFQDDSKRREKTEAIVRIGDISIEPLIQALTHEHIAVRREAAWALGTLGNNKAIDPLVHALIDRDYASNMAAMALDILKWKPRNDIETVYYLIAKNKWTELEKFGKIAVEPLCQILVLEYRKEICKILGRIGDKRAVGPLVEVMVDNVLPYLHESEIVVTAEALANIGDINALPPLMYVEMIMFRISSLESLSIQYILKGIISQLIAKRSKKDESEAESIKSSVRILTAGYTEEKKLTVEHMIFKYYPTIKESIDSTMAEEGISLSPSTLLDNPRIGVLRKFERLFGKEEEEMYCDFCGKPISLSMMVLVSARKLQNAVENGFNPYKTPDIDMGITKDFINMSGVGNDVAFAEFKRRVINDNTDWALCPECGVGFNIWCLDGCENGNI